jgi:polar amino acid transport system substrate-binding protein
MLKNKLFSLIYSVSALLLLICISTVPVIPTNAQEEPQYINSVVLGIKPIDPFIIQKDGLNTGFSMDLWHEIARNLGITTKETKTYTNVSGLIDGAAKQEIDVGIAAVSITPERERKIDFSYPMYKSGLSILTTSTEKQSIIPGILQNIWEAVSSQDFLYLAAIMVALSIIPAIILYLSERRKIDGFLDTQNIFKGVFQSYCWCVAGLFGQHDGHPQTRTGKIFGMIWIFFSILFFTFFSAQITATLTTDKINGQIQGIEDLKDKKVATIKGTTSASYLIDKNFDTTQYDDLKSAVESVDKGNTAAVVYDKPALEYYANTNSSKKYLVVGGAFTVEDYGIVFPNNSPLRKKVNEELLKMNQNGEYEKIRVKWFGEASKA